MNNISWDPKFKCHVPPVQRDWHTAVPTPWPAVQGDFGSTGAALRPGGGTAGPTKPGVFTLVLRRKGVPVPDLQQGLSFLCGSTRGQDTAASCGDPGPEATSQGRCAAFIIACGVSDVNTSGHSGWG